MRPKIYSYCDKRRGVTYWQVCWYNKKGRIRRTFEDEAEALIQLDVVLNLRRAGFAALAETPIEDLVRLAFHHKNGGILPENSGTAITVAEVSKKWMESIAPFSRRHQETAASHCRSLNAMFGPRMLSEISTAELDTYIKSRSESPTTQGNYRATVKNLWRWAQKKGFLSQNILTAADRTDRPAQVISEPKILTPAQMNQLVARVGEQYPNALPYLVIAGFAGVRAAEILRMKWSCWNRQDSTLVLGSEITKTNRRRIIRIEDNLRLWLEQLARDPQEPIVPSRQKNSSDKSTDVKEIRALHQRFDGDWPPNALRHSYISYHLEKYGNAPLTAKHAGNTVGILEQHYLSLASHVDADEWFAIAPTWLVAGPDLTDLAKPTIEETPSCSAILSSNPTPGITNGSDTPCDPSPNSPPDSVKPSSSPPSEAHPQPAF